MGRGSESRGVGQTPLFPELGSGQHVSYWNAFLFVSVSISSKNVNLYQMLCFLITLITFNQDLNAQYNFKTLKPTI